MPLSSLGNEDNIIYIMSAILGTLISLLYALISIQDKTPNPPTSFLPNPKTQPSKNAYELFVWKYTLIWISCFGCIVVFQLYEQFESFHYNLVCIGLALPFLLQPILHPGVTTTDGGCSPDGKRRILERHSWKANLWIAIFSFIGNYWYTHYFYSVLKAKYTFLTNPMDRLNNVPIALYFATHFYFSTYHVLSNYCLRQVTSLYQPSLKRNILFVGVILVLSYTTAFMETLTISSFPYYSFENRFMAYTAGSAFYGIYFIVSFPMFYFLDEDVDRGCGIGVWRVVVESCGCGMIVLCFLDFVRLGLDIPLTIGK